MLTQFFLGLSLFVSIIMLGYCVYTNNPGAGFFSAIIFVTLFIANIVKY